MKIRDFSFNKFALGANLRVIVNRQGGGQRNSKVCRKEGRKRCGIYGCMDSFCAWQF